MQSSLTPRQRQVLALVWDGLSRPAIAHRLGIGQRRVHHILEEARARVGAATTIGLLRWWIEHRLGTIEITTDAQSLTRTEGTLDRAWNITYAGSPDPSDRLPGATTGGPAS